MEVFSKSSREQEREQDDEEAPKWDTLEKLPSYGRLRRGISTTSKGEVSEVDICDLGFEERKYLLDKLVKVSDKGNEKFLAKLRNRINTVGIKLPSIEVRFEHLNVEAQASVGSRRALPTIPNNISDIFEGFVNFLRILPSRKKQLTVLEDISGIIKPSRMTLLLGPPSSGKTTFLLALAGKLDPTLQCSGTVTYNGHKMNEFIPQRTAAYISQYDLHLAQMTVRETLTFSARCQGFGSRHEMLTELLRREKEANILPDPDIDVFMKAMATEGQETSVVIDYVLKMLGLEVCADTIVGNISGGQKKRLTAGEMLVGPARALFMDEISTCLDSSTTFQIVNSLRQYVHIFDGTAVISLLQPTPETYDLFDHIILLSDSKIVYQGPRENVMAFFEQTGFKCPERKGVADFLLEVTSKKDQEQYWARKDQPCEFVTVNEFAEAFQSFNVGKRILDELSIPFDKTKNHPAALATKQYGVGMLELIKANLSREYLLMKRNSFVQIFKLCQLAILSTISLTIFLRTEMHRNSVNDGGIYSGAIFFTTMSIMLNGMSELSQTIAKLPVFYKQRDLRFYPSWAYSLPPYVLKIPLSFVEVFGLVFLTYYVIGFDPNVGRLFKKYLLLILINQMASALFRFTAAVGRDIIIANTLGTFALFALFALGGFIISRDEIKKWWVWAYWISPLMYEQNAVVVNEFLGDSWSHIPKTSNSTETLGIQVLKSHKFFTKAYWYWIGIGVISIYVLLFNVGFTLALSFLNPIEKPQAVIFEQSKSKKSGGEKKTESGVEKVSGSGSESIGKANGSMKKGMVLPFEPHFITFDEVTYSIDMPKEMKVQGVVEDRLVLLKGVSGAFRPGVLTALMGVSGAGKTTLMDVLSGRKTGGYIEGDIKISGYPKKRETFARIAGYCEQNDIHSPHVTVYESLLYSAWLRLPLELDAETRKMFIDEVMELLELNSLRHALVGLPGVDGLSTEQRKRLTIAVELIANPSIIFMDEPTSGLDARAAEIVMRTIRNIMDTGRTVVCTIHQPNMDLFEAFDELFLMKQGGQEIYVGPLGLHAAHLVKYFEEIEGVSKIKNGYNPATWMLEVTTPAQEMALGIDFAKIYKNSDLYRRNKALIAELSAPAPGSKDLYFPTLYSTSFFTQCMACLWKQNRSYWRNAPYTAMRFLYTTFIALMIGTVFWDLGSKLDNSQDLSNAMGTMYTTVFFLGVQNAVSVQPIVAVERTVFYKEKAAGMYSALPYALAQVLIELPHNFVQAAIYGSIVYAMVGFESSVAKFFWYLLFMYFTLLYFTFYGMMAVATTPNQQIAAIVSSAIYAIWNLFSGVVIPRTRIPVWWRWYYWACPVSWTLYGLLASQFGDIKKTLDSGETVEQFLKDYFGFRHDFLGAVAAAVLGFAFLFALIFAFSIKAFNFHGR